MAFQWKRCLGMVAAGATILGLTACGSSSVESALYPTRVIAFGDGHSDIGQSGARYTVSGGDDVANWTEYVATQYGLTLAPAAEGGLSYAQGNSRVVLQPDVAGNADSATLAQQIDSFLASQQFGETDLVLVSAGTSDIIAIAQAALQEEITGDEARAQARAAGEALSSEIQRMMASGGRNISIAGTYDLSQSIWGRATEATDLLSELSAAFNEGFKIAMHEQGYANEALYIDFERFIDEALYYPSYYSISDIDTAVCTTVDSGAGIGIGAGQINSALCTVDTVTNSDYNAFAFADAVYFTPNLHRQFGSTAYSQISYRW